MVGLRLVRLIETHSHELATELIKKMQTSPRTRGMRNVPSEELQERAYEILHHLSEWLLTKSEVDIQERYRRIGERRAAQGVPLSDYCWAIVLTKRHVWDFLQRQGSLRGPVELYGEIELLQLLDHFFDSALCYAANGYEQSTEEQQVPVEKPSGVRAASN